LKNRILERTPVPQGPNPRQDRKTCKIAVTRKTSPEILLEIPAQRRKSTKVPQRGNLMLTEANLFTIKQSTMSKKDNINKGTDRDVRPQRGQQSNENWDDNNNTLNTGTGTGRTDARRTEDETNTTGAGSSQRDKDENVGPLESDLEQLPSEKRRDRGSNLTGPGIG
jgi:hypothetical protein